MKQVKLLFLFVLTFAAVAGMTSCGGGENKKENNKDQLADTGSVDYKIARLTELIEKSPKDYQHYYDRSLLYYEAQNIDMAIRDIEKCIENFDKWPDGYQLRGFYAYVQNRDEEALRDFQKASELGSTDPENFYQGGQIYYFREQYKEAEEWYDIAIRLDTMEPTYYFAKGYLYETLKDFKSAVKLYEKAREKDPGFIKALWRLHLIYKDVLNDPGRALQYNDMILAVDSLHPVGTFNLGVNYMEMALELQKKKPDDQEGFRILMNQAIGQYNRTLQRDRRFQNAAFNRGYCLMQTGRYEEALSDFATAIELDPYNDKAFFLMGSLQEMKGDYPAAVASYEQAVRINPNFREASEGIRDLKGRPAKVQK